jgi:hypothetical protein
LDPGRLFGFRDKDVHDSSNDPGFTPAPSLSLFITSCNSFIAFCVYRRARFILQYAVEGGDVAYRRRSTDLRVRFLIIGGAADTLGHACSTSRPQRSTTFSWIHIPHDRSRTDLHAHSDLAVDS